jgi:AcrR family transcriptional regulator
VRTVDGVTGTRRRRADAELTRQAIFRATNLLVQDRHGLDFKLADVAEAAGIGAATVYRHFSSVHQLCVELHRSIYDELSSDFERITAESTGLRRFLSVCDHWVTSSVDWGAVAAYVRRGEGYLQQLRRGDPLVVRFHASLDTAVRGLVADGIIPEQDHDYAIMMWITMFDERAIFDLRTTLGWTDERIARTLSRHVLAVLTTDVEHYTTRL